MAEARMVFSFPLTFFVAAMVFDNTKHGILHIIWARMITEGLGMACSLNVVGVELAPR